MTRVIATDDAPAIPASDAQLRYIHALLAEKDTTTLIPGRNSRPLGPVEPGNLTGGRGGTASALIEWLSNRPAKTAEARAPKREIHEGLWIKRLSDTEYIAFLVQRTKNDKGWNVKEWSEGFTDEDGVWVYIGGVATLPSEAHPATREEALAFTHAFGRCSECGKTLTVKESRDAGIGPICSGKLDAR